MKPGTCYYVFNDFIDTLNRFKITVAHPYYWGFHTQTEHHNANYKFIEKYGK